MRPKLLLPLIAALTATATPAAARAADCVPLPTTKAFDQVDGDRADYSVAPAAASNSAASRGPSRAPPASSPW